MSRIDFSAFDGRYKYERCAAIARDFRTKKYFLIEVTNSHEDPKHHFAIRHGDLEAAFTRYPMAQLTGFMHTHPDGASRFPSKHDIAAASPGMMHVVYHPSSGSEVWYDGSGIVMKKMKLTKE